MLVALAALLICVTFPVPLTLPPVTARLKDLVILCGCPSTTVMLYVVALVITLVLPVIVPAVVLKVNPAGKLGVRL